MALASSLLNLSLAFASVWPIGWLTSALTVGLVVAICSVHRHDTVQAEGGEQGKVGDTLNLDLNDMMNMAKKYLGEEGVSKLMNGDYSQFEKIGKQILGGKVEGSEILNTILKAIPEGTLGKKLDDSEEANTPEEVDEQA